MMVLDGKAQAARGPTVEWKVPPVRTEVAPVGFATWRQLATEDLQPARAPRGLAATITGGGVPEQRRMDPAVATMLPHRRGRCSRRRRFTATWTGKLNIRRAGKYNFSLVSQHVAVLQIDGREVLRTPRSRDGVRLVPVRDAPRRDVSGCLRYRVSRGQGRLEWRWIPPGGRQSFVPASVRAIPWCWRRNADSRGGACGPVRSAG